MSSKTKQVNQKPRGQVWLELRQKGQGLAQRCWYVPEHFVISQQHMARAQRPLGAPCHN